MNSAKKYVVGLTGGIGSGKSAAAEIFRALGVEVIDADALAREVVELGQPALSDIAAHFGSGILTDEGNLNRAALRKIVFSNPEHRSWLENLLHPLIAELLQHRLNAAKSPYTILESPLLLETEQYKLVQRVLVIDASEETQIDRSVRRDGSDEEVIRSIIASQIDRLERIQHADDLVTNEESLEQLRENIETLHSKYMRMVT
ncbi:MAG: dephospho-CoA kinase [SAR86 cluster bacterium]|uniref:Dephospho-CoA kinase n=1 Tax=SAR86 cluster bacterium TaxID=2030880 RepID=A0A2A4XH40_9GAMM|nr:MAG: dephospho-CoA kinase [SAR86 cluster bacterium]